MLIYNVPAALMEQHRGRPVIVRSESAAELGESARGIAEELLFGLQLLNVSPDTGPFPALAEPQHIELVLSQDASPNARFLEAHIHLTEIHNVAVTVPVAPGFSQAARTAASLGFLVKLQVGELARFAVSEVLELLDYYLHTPTLSQPVEFFHSALQNVYSAQFGPKEVNGITLWQIQDEDPSRIRYVADDGQQVISARLAGLVPAADLDSFLEEYQLDLALERSECSICPYFTTCGGYFKLPNRAFDCVEVKQIFHELTLAARKLYEDMEAYEKQRAQSSD